MNNAYASYCMLLIESKFGAKGLNALKLVEK